MSKEETYTIRVVRPKGVTISQMKDYICEAVACWGGEDTPGNPLFPGVENTTRYNGNCFLKPEEDTTSNSRDLTKRKTPDQQAAIDEYWATIDAYWVAETLQQKRDAARD